MRQNFIKGGKMKTYLSIFTMSSILLMSCSSYTINTHSSTQDDLYFSKSDADNKPEVVYNPEVQVQDMSKANTSSYTEENIQNSNANYQNYNSNNSQGNTTNQNPNYSTQQVSPNEQESYVDENGRTIVNNYYGDVYDDGDSYYSTRIRRFHRPYTGFTYYSPAYCGFYADPFWGSGWNIGIGYSYGWGSNWAFNYGFNYGFGFDPFFDPWFSPWYNPWMSPYYGFGGWNSYAWGYRNGYWDGRNDNGYWNGGWGGRKNTTVLNGPRPSRGGNVSTGGNRTVPTRDGVAENSDGNSVRSVPSRSLPSVSKPANNGGTREGTSTVREVPNTSPNGYVPPRLPNVSNTTREPSSGNSGNVSPAPVRNNNPNYEGTVIRSNSNPPVKVNPNYGGSSESTPRSSAPVRISSPRNENSSPRMSAPSRSSSPSMGSSPSRGSSPAPASRPRPR